MSIAPVISISSEAPETSYAMERYRGAYQGARDGAKLADNIRYGGIFAAGVLVVVALLVYQALPSERFDRPIISGSITALAIFVALASQIWGIVFSFQSRLLETLIDTAVCSSPFLTDEQRATLMFLEEEAKKSGVEIVNNKYTAA